MSSKRTMFWFSILVILSLLVAGCGPIGTTGQTTQPTSAGSGASQTTPSGDNGAASGTVPSDIQATLTIWDTGTEYYQWVEDVAVPLFKEKYPNVEIVHTGIPYDQFTLKVDTAATAGDLPDLIADEVPWGNAKWYKAGLFVPLNDYMARDQVNRQDFCGLIDTTSATDENVYLLPMFVNFWAMLYNKDMFREAGLPELTTESITTFDEWLEYSRKLNKPADTLEDRVWGSQMIRPDWNLMNGAMSDPYYLGPEANTCEGYANTPEMLHAWDVVVDFYEEDLTPETGQTLLGDQDAWLFFTEGKVAMSYGDMSMANQAVEKGVNVGITGQPVLEKDFPMNTGIYGMGYGITKASENPDLAWEFIKMTATVIPLELVGAKEYGEATAGIPCYKPIADQYITESNNPLLEDAQKMIARFEPGPFMPDGYAGGTVIWEEIFTRVVEGGEELETVVNESMELCQDAVDEVWEQWDSIQ